MDLDLLEPRFKSGAHEMGEWAYARSELIIESLSGPISDLRGPASGACDSNSLSNGIRMKKRLSFHILCRQKGFTRLLQKLGKALLYTCIHILLIRPGIFTEMGKI